MGDARKRKRISDRWAVAVDAADDLIDVRLYENGNGGDDGGNRMRHGSGAFWILNFKPMDWWLACRLHQSSRAHLKLSSGPFTWPLVSVVCEIANLACITAPLHRQCPPLGQLCQPVPTSCNFATCVWLSTAIYNFLLVYSVVLPGSHRHQSLPPSVRYRSGTTAQVK